MASPTNADLHRRLTVDTRSHLPPISKDMLVPDGSIPLSPEWLLPKLGDNKHSPVAVDPHSHGRNSVETMKAVGNSEDLCGGEKKKDVYRPSFHDNDGRHDRWHDEEREINSTVRRDRWREGEKELGDSRKVERWSESSSRYSGEVRRLPSERWTDPGNRENAYDPRRESKWNTHWGPVVKDSEQWREKWTGKDGESRDKGAHHLTIHGKEGSNHNKNTHKEDEHHSRAWRLSPSLIHERGEATTYLPLNQNKPIPNMGYGRGKADNGISIFSAGRGRAATNTGSMGVGSTRPPGIASERSNYSHGDRLPLRYSRMKMLDIYRSTNLKEYKKSFEGFLELSSLMEAEPLEPLAINAPISEELAILRAIDKGDIVGSGISQASKDGSTGKNLLESGLSRPTKSDATSHREEIPENAKNDNFGVVESFDFDAMVATGQSQLGYRGDKLTFEAFKYGSTSANDSICRESRKLDGVPLSSQSLGEQSLKASNNLLGFGEAVSVSSDLRWLHMQKEVDVEPVSNNSASSSYLKDDRHWQNAQSSHSEVTVAESHMRKQPSNIVEQERDGSVLHGHDEPFTQRDKSSDTKFLQYISPENLWLCYKDPQGHIQGPFSGSDLIGWFEAGYFGIDLQVRLASAPSDAPFSLLGDVIPQLRARVRPPPGFGMAKQSEFVEVLNKGKLGVPRDIYARVTESELVKNDREINIESKLEAENRFIESLMSGRASSLDSESRALGEGVLGYPSMVSGRSSYGAEGMSNMNYLVQKMSLEQQRSLPTPYWPTKDLPAVVSTADFVNGYPIPHSKFPQMGEASHHTPQSPNPLELLSILHHTADKSPPVAISSATTLHNLHDVQTLKHSHGSDINKNTMDLNHCQQNINSHIGFGTPQSLQTKLQPLSNFTQHGDFSGGVIPPEKFVTSEFSGDPQMIHLLQQQYMLSHQLHSQVPLPAQNVSPIDLLLLMQRQKQEQQQKLLMQQQQHLISHVLSANQLQQIVSEVPLRHLTSGVPCEISTPDNSPLQKVHDELQSKLHIPAYGSETSTISNLHGAQHDSFTDSSEHVQSYVPNQIIERISEQNLGDANGGNTQNLNAIQSAFMEEGLPSPLNLHNQIFEPTSQPNLKDANDESAQNFHAKQNVLVKDSAADGSAKEGFLEQRNALDMEAFVASEGASQPTEIVASTAGHENIPVLSESNIAVDDSTPSICEKFNDALVLVSADTISKQADVQNSAQKVTKGTELQEGRKATEKKSRKQKSSQIRTVSQQLKEPLKALPELSQAKLATKETIDCKKEKGMPIEAAKPPCDKTLEAGFEMPAPNGLESSNFHDAQISLSDVCLGKKFGVEEWKLQEGGVSAVSLANVHISPKNQAWKPAKGQKARSLIEIQQEEQMKVQAESLPSNNISVIKPMDDSVLSNVSVNSGQKYIGDTLQGVTSTPSIVVNPVNLLDSSNRISNLQYVLDEEISAKPCGACDFTGSNENGSALPSVQQSSAQIEMSVVDDDDFVEAKDSRRIRKRSKKNKGAVMKASKPLTADDSFNLTGISEKTKPTKAGQVEVYLPVPSAPSLGDFVLWKGDQANSVPAPAWSADSAKLQKPTSLRDILREQQNKTNPSQPQIQTPTMKVQRHSSEGISSLQASAASPSKGLPSMNLKTVSPIQSPSPAQALSKMQTEDDFFWGPLDHAKTGARSDLSTAANSSTSSTKGNHVSNRKHSSSSSSSQSLSKLNKNAASKHSEAMDFRDWCEREWFNLTGTNDTSFIEFCLKQKPSEAEVLLKENLRSLDRNHEFVDMFLNYMEFLSPDVVEAAFQGPKNGDTPRREGAKSSQAGNEDADGGDGSGRGGKKKGKKGKKLDPTILGFNVVSNRIMMGEIQTVED